MRGDDAFRAEVASRIEAVERELRRIGDWQDTPLPPEALEFEEAFGRDRLAFPQWLQFVLVPRVREILDGDGEFPAGSGVAVQGVREYDGHPDAGPLLHALSEFDALFNSADGGATEADIAAPQARDSSDAAAPPGRPVPPDEAAEAVFAVRGFVIGLQVGNPAAARSHVTRPMRDDESFVPQPPFEIRDFVTAPPEPHVGCVVVRTRLEGVAPGGAPAEETMPFVVVREDGAWRVDLERTMGMMATGSPHSGAEAALRGALEAAADRMSDTMATALDAVTSVFDEQREREFFDAAARFDEATRPGLEEVLGARLGVPVRIELDWSASDGAPRRVRDLTRFLSDELLPATAMLSDAARGRVADGLARVLVRFAPNRAARGVWREGDALALVLHPELEEAPYSPVLARMVELRTDPSVSVQFVHAWERIGEWQDDLRDRLGVRAVVDAEWQRFSASDRTDENAWAIYLLAEHGIDPLRAALDRVLGDPGEPSGALVLAREKLREIQIERAWTPAGRSVTADEGAIRFALYVDATHRDYWSADDLVPKVTAALRALR